MDKTIPVNMTQLTTHWRTTLIGFVILLQSIHTSVHFDAAGHLTMTEQDWFYLAIGVLGQVVGFIMKDAGVTEVQTPSGQVEAVDSHEVPDVDVPANKILPVTK